MCETVQVFELDETSFVDGAASLMAMSVESMDSRRSSWIMFPDSSETKFPGFAGIVPSRPSLALWYIPKVQLFRSLHELTP